MLSSIRARILATCVAIVVTALAVTGGLVYYVVKQHNDETIDQNHKSILAGHALAINEWVASRGRETQALADTIAIGEGDPLPALKLLGKLRPDGTPVVQAGRQRRQPGRDGTLS
jgi:methyl-accepting chemotaxis protein